MKVERVEVGADISSSVKSYIKEAQETGTTYEFEANGETYTITPEYTYSEYLEQMARKSKPQLFQPLLREKYLSDTLEKEVAEYRANWMAGSALLDEVYADMCGEGDEIWTKREGAGVGEYLSSFALIHVLRKMAKLDNLSPVMPFFTLLMRAYPDVYLFVLTPAQKEALSEFDKCYPDVPQEVMEKLPSLQTIFRWLVGQYVQGALLHNGTPDMLDQFAETFLKMWEKSPQSTGKIDWAEV